MHRSTLISRTPLIVLLTFLAGMCLDRAGRAADDPVALPQPQVQREGAGLRGNVLVVPMGTTQRLQMKDKKVIQSVVNPKENIIFVQPVEGDPRTVLVTGREAGMAKVTLTAADKSEETYEVHV